MTNTLILDLDGPILDGKLRHYQCYCDILTEHGFTPVPMDAYWRMKRERQDRHAQLSVSGADGIYDMFLREWQERIEQRKYLGLDRLQPGVIEKLLEFQAVNTKMLLVTLRNNHKNLRWQLDNMQLTRFFAEILPTTCSGAEIGKAEKVRPFLNHLDPACCVWVGDTEVDLKAARILGIPICLVSNGLRTPQYLAILNPDHLLPGFETANFFIQRQYED